MSQFISMFLEPYQFWLILGGILLIIELLGTSGYMLWSGISAIIIGLLAWLLPISWYWAWILFALLSIITLILWWYWLRAKQRKNRSAVLLTQPFNEFIGKRYDLIEPLHNGFGRIKIGDSTWRVEAAEELPIGATIEVVALKSNTFLVRPVTK